MIDTHTHLYLQEFDPSPQDAVRRAIDAGVTRMIFPNVDLSTVELQRRLHEQFPANTFMAMGLHPTEIDGDWVENLKAIESELQTHRDDYIAIGEVGIDLYWDKTFRNQQREALAIQTGWAAEMHLPLIIHCREGLDDTLDVLGASGFEGDVVFHSFTGTGEDVRCIRDIVSSPYFGINGVVTFKNAHLRETLPEIGLDRMLLETDSPYLTPVPHRGKRNESAYLVHTAAHIASSLGLPIQEVDEATTRNAEKVFRLNTI
jgi:hydrolase, tatD family